MMSSKAKGIYYISCLGTQKEPTTTEVAYLIIFNDSEIKHVISNIIVHKKPN